ncbi:uncharacterized protein LOC129757958 [Uranotaenia lowii]|uniref:uncharacterized protein LOC129757958 n=1 Tax=Uranotaenia lowii TaxID=190385 RepID=UPI002479548D|nr:uncharacterized protein LOC129757958 [Uranotaenia lowii]
MNYESYDLSGFYFIVIVGSIGDERAEIVGNIMNDLWKLDVFNVNVLVAGKAQVAIFTFYPYSSTHCGSVEPILWHNFSSLQTIPKFDWYPNRLQTFYGCPLKGGTVDILPYSMLQLQRASTKIIHRGFEGDIIDLLKYKLNFTVQYKVPSTDELWGFIGERGKSTGLMKMIQEGDVDFGVGCLGFTYDRHFYLKPGIAYYTTSVIFAVPSGRPYKAFEKLFRPLDLLNWILILVCIIVAMVVIGVLRKTTNDCRTLVYGVGTRTPCLNMINVLFGGVQLNFPRTNFARTILVLWIYFTLILRSVYQGSLYTYLQKTMNHPPLQTMRDIDLSGVDYYMLEVSKRFFVSVPSVMQRTRFLKPGRDTIGQAIEQLGLGQLEGVVLVTFDLVAYHNKMSPKQQKVFITRDKVSSYPFGIYYPKNSRLTSVFDRQIRNLEATGLIGFWIRQYGDYDFFRKPIDSDVPRALRNEHLAGCYQVFGGFLGASFVIFVLELVSTKIKVLRKVLLCLID